MLNNLFAKKESKNVENGVYNNPEEMPYLVEYICSNVPLKGIPVNSIYVFTEDAYNLFGVMLTPGIFKVPVIVYKVSEQNFNFFNYDLNLIGGLSFSKDFKILRTFGRDFQVKSSFASYRLMNLAFDYSATEDLIQKKFDSVQRYVLKK